MLFPTLLSKLCCHSIFWLHQLMPHSLGSCTAVNHNTGSKVYHNGKQVPLHWYPLAWETGVLTTNGCKRKSCGINSRFNSTRHRISNNYTREKKGIKSRVNSKKWLDGTRGIKPPVQTPVLSLWCKELTQGSMHRKGLYDHVGYQE